MYSLEIISTSISAFLQGDLGSSLALAKKSKFFSSGASNLSDPQAYITSKTQVAINKSSILIAN